MFPFDIRGEIALPGIQPGQVPIFVSQIAQAASAQRASRLVKTDSAVSFRGGVFRFVGNWNVFVPITRADIEVCSGEPGIVRYRFTCTEMLVFATTFALIAGIAFFQQDPAFGIAAALVTWGWLFGMNYLISSARLPAFLRKAMR